MQLVLFRSSRLDLSKTPKPNQYRLQKLESSQDEPLQMRTHPSGECALEAIPLGGPTIKILPRFGQRWIATNQPLRLTLLASQSSKKSDSIVQTIQSSRPRQHSSHYVAKSGPTHHTCHTGPTSRLLEIWLRSQWMENGKRGIYTKTREGFLRNTKGFPPDQSHIVSSQDDGESTGWTWTPTKRREQAVRWKSTCLPQGPLYWNGPPPTSLQNRKSLLQQTILSCHLTWYIGLAASWSPQLSTPLPLKPWKGFLT